MKKILSLLTVFTLLMVFSACDNIGDNGVDIIDQTYDITVEVLDENDQPVSDIGVVVNSDEIYDTDDSGRVDISSLEGENRIEIQDDSYPSKTVDSSNDGDIITFRPDEVTGSGLTIRGKLSDESEVQAADTSNNPDIGQIVLIFRYGYEVIDIENETFSIDFPREPGAITFVDADGNYAGNLALENGMDSIPGDLIDEDTNEIDLGLITFEDGTAYSEDDEVVFDSLTIQDNDLDAVAVAGSFFSAAAISPDLVEMMATESQEIRLQAMYFVSNMTLTEPDEDNIVKINNFKDLEIENHQLEIAFTPQVISDSDIEDDNNTSGIDFYLSYNNGSPEYFRDDQVINHYDTTNIYFQRDGLPGAGEYFIENNIENLDEFTFYLPDVIDQAEDHFITLDVEIELFENDEGDLLIDRINWTYKTLSGQKLTDPENILTGQEVQISAHTDDRDELKGEYYESDIHGPGRIYSSDKITDLSDTVKDLRDEEIYWDDVGSINLPYDDLYDVHYVTGYIKTEQN
ncbi:hypothetical protein I0Q91_08035 [Halanaerobiaceae bacterium Z-7014]|uniref:Carboxypeptidase regulatory-like domain-containing protein n=1 Tax=Halonatronomonas betaini TaxID=2778430 RepID=A0A931FAI8_9FIRM|nr:hypothetical protein [Halonatronomonas betaini]MBF8437022.1 hypothetical protein [Halonatronomonas betaini]